MNFLYESLWPVVTISSVCACLLSGAIGYDAGHERGCRETMEQFRRPFAPWPRDGREA